MVGVLGLQGDYEAHGRLLHRDGVAVRYVKRPEQLKEIAGLIIPGGESTTLIKLMDVVLSPAYDPPARGADE